MLVHPALPLLSSRLPSRGAAWSRLASWWAALLVMFAVSPAFARDVPALAARVTDEAGMLSPEARQRIEQRLADYERATGQQFAVLTIDSLDGDALEPFSIRVVEAWKLGKAKADDGLLLLLVKNDRKVRIEVGYGLEGTITDAVSSRVIREVLTPALRSGQTDAGVEAALTRLMEKASGGEIPEAEAAPEPRTTKRGSRTLGLFTILLVLVPLFFFGGFGGGGRFGRRGGFGGGFGGGGFGGGGFGGGGFGGGGFGGGGGGGGFSGGGGGFGGGGSSGSW